MPRHRRAETLFEVLMSSVNLNMVDVDLGWSIAEAFHKGWINTRRGVKLLTEACMACEPEKTVKILRGEKL